MGGANTAGAPYRPGRQASNSKLTGQGHAVTGISISNARATSAKKSKTNLPVEIIENRLYWISGPRPPTSHTDAYFFSVDSELVYDPFNNDFGPLNLAMVHKFVRELVRLLADP